MNRRVVVTGLGMVSPLGVNVDNSWSLLLEGTSGISKIEKFDTEGYACKIAGQVKRGARPGEFDPNKYLTPKEQKKVDDFILFAIAAADEAFKSANLSLESYEDQIRAGVVIGSGIGGLPKIEKTAQDLMRLGPRKVSPFFIPSCLSNLASGYVSVRHKLKGVNQAQVTACAAGAHSIGEAFYLIKSNRADVMLAGGAESAVSPIGIAGFCSMKALSTKFNDTPEKASRPWDKQRDGFVMGEGAGVLVLEEYEKAKSRGANILAEVTGYGASGDAFHITAPDGDGGYRAMDLALKSAGLKPQDIDYINAHGTSTPVGDGPEVESIQKLFKSHELCLSSTKSSTGHLLGAAGGVEAVFSVLALKNNIVPATLNLDDPMEVSPNIDLVPNRPKTKYLKHVLSNSFGFGGTNASLIFSKLN